MIRSFGVAGLQERIREHIALAKWFEQQVAENHQFELLAPVTLSVVCFRWHPRKVHDENEINALNIKLLERLNASGKLYLTHTRLNGKYTLRMSIAGTLTEKRHVENAWALIRKLAEGLE